MERGPFRFDLIPEGKAVICALSGGADSMYLLCRLLEGRERFCWTVRAAHYNHRLRPTAQRDEDFVRAWCGEHNVPLTTGRGDVAAFARREGLSVEEAARTLRYAFLEHTAEAEGGALIATGHHAGDNAETVLMNLIRGCGLNGLTGIPERRGNIVRPMLEAERTEIEAYLTRHNVPHVEDETNADLNYTRNRVRRQLLPLLEALNPRAASHIAAAARRLREDEEVLSRQAVALCEQALDIPEGIAIPARALAGAPRPLALRACALLAERTGLGCRAVHLEESLALAAGEDPSASLDVPGGTIRRQYDLLVLTRRQEREPPAPLPLALGENRWGDWTVLCEEAVCPGKAYVSPEEFYLRPGEYLLRVRAPGDRITLGKRPDKTVKKLMIDEKIPAVRREYIPVLALGERVAAVGGFGPDRECLAAPGGPALHITLFPDKT